MLSMVIVDVGPILNTVLQQYVYASLIKHLYDWWITDHICSKNVNTQFIFFIYIIIIKIYQML